MDAADTASKVRDIISKQFEQEIAYKQSELELINERIYLTKQVLSGLRVAIIAKYFATPEVADDEAAWNNGLDNCVHPTVRSYFGRKTIRSETEQENGVQATYDLPVKISTATLLRKEHVAKVSTVKSLQSVRFIVGNVSKYIAGDNPENRVTHLWMAYVRLHPDSSERIEDLVSKVRFFLHPSYAPHDVIDVTYPFHLKRKGWGEFQLRGQIHFLDPLNKPADVLHELKLDQHKRGIQTNGGETHLEIKLMVERPLEKSPAKDVKPPLPVLPPPPFDETLIKQEVVDHDENNEPEQVDRNAVTATADSTVKLEECPTNAFNLEALGHDYCTSPLPTIAPFILVASGSPMPWDNPPGVRIMRGESLLKTRTVLQNPQTAQVVTPWLEAVGKWEQALKSLDFTQDAMTLVDVLANRLFTLVGDRAVGDLSFQVGSNKEFLELPVTKQRAIEWFRASHIRRILHKHGVSEVPSTRAILLHLRRHGFTPLHETTDIIDHQVTQQLSSLSVANLPAELELLEVPTGRKKNEINCDVDVVTVEPVDETPLKRNQFKAPLLRFAYDVMREVVNESAMSDDKQELEDTLQTLLAAAKSFSLSLLRKSLAQSFARNGSTYQVDGILPSDVYGAVTATEHFDFLSNDGLAMHIE